MNKLVFVALALTGACSYGPLEGDSGYGPVSGTNSAWTIGLNDTAGSVFRLDSDGAHEVESFSGEGLTSITARSSDDVWAIGTSLHHYDGHTWTTTAMPSDPVFLIGDGWAIGVNGTIYDPASFTALAGPDSHIDLVWQDVNPPSAWGDGPNDVWALAGAHLFHFTTAWTDVTPWTADESPQQLTGTSVNDVWVSTFSGAMYRYDGASWTVVASGVTDALFAGMFAAASDDVWAVGYPDVVVHYNGNAWSAVAAPQILSCGEASNQACEDVGLNGVLATSASDVWVTGYLQQDPGGSPVLFHYDGTWHDLSDLGE